MKHTWLREFETAHSQHKVNLADRLRASTSSSRPQSANVRYVRRSSPGREGLGRPKSSYGLSSSCAEPSFNFEYNHSSVGSGQIKGTNEDSGDLSHVLSEYHTGGRRKWAPHSTEMDMEMLRSEQQLELAELPYIDETNYAEPDLPSIFSDEYFKSTLVTSLTDGKTDSRARTSRVVQDAMMPIDARAANAAFLDPGGHISRAKGITINGDVKVKPERIMYSFGSDLNGVDSEQELKLYNSHKTILNPEWDHNFVADRALSPEKFKRRPTSHKLKQEIQNYVNRIFSSPSTQAKLGTFTTKYKNGNRPKLIIKNIESNNFDSADCKLTVTDTRVTKSANKRSTPKTKNSSLHHQVSASLPSVNLFSDSVDDNDSDINFRMTDSIEMAINEYGAYPTQSVEDSVDLHLNLQDHDNSNNSHNEDKKEGSALEINKANSLNNSLVVSQESSSIAITLPDHVVTKAEEHWLSLLHNLREIGTEVVYKDITILSTCATSSSTEDAGLTADAINEFVVIFILQLLGLKSTWQSAQVSLFKEPFPFIKFLREVEPLSLPVRRVRKANQYFESTMMGKEDEIMRLTLSESTMKLFRWILAFKKMADLIMKADSISTPSKFKSKEKRGKQMKVVNGQENDKLDIYRLQKLQQQRLQKNKRTEEDRQKGIENSLQKERERLRTAAKNLDEKPSGKHIKRKDKKERMKKYPVIPKSVLNRGCFNSDENDSVLSYFAIEGLTIADADTLFSPPSTINNPSPRESDDEVHIMSLKNRLADRFLEEGKAKTETGFISNVEKADVQGLGLEQMKETAEKLEELEKEKEKEKHRLDERLQEKREALHADEEWRMLEEEKEKEKERERERLEERVSEKQRRKQLEELEKEREKETLSGSDSCQDGVITSTFNVGDSVEAQYKQGYKWFPGKIAAVNNKSFNTTCDIKYDDGDFERDVYEEFIRKLQGTNDSDSASGHASPTKSTIISV